MADPLISDQTKDPRLPATGDTVTAQDATPKTPSTDKNVGTMIAGLAGTLGALPQTQAGYNNAENGYRNALGNYQNIYGAAASSPLQVQLQQAAMTNYSPAYLQTTPTVGAGAFQNVGPDQAVQQQQMQNNAMLQGVAQSGYTPEMMAAYNQMLNGTNSNLQSQLQGIMQNQAARGMGSSGASLALRENANQAALNNSSQQAGQIAGQGFQNKLAAMGQLGGLTNAQQGQLMSGALQKAQGLQNQEQFGTKLTSDIAGQNVARQQNQANLQSQLANQMAQFNAGIINQQQMQNNVQSIIQRSGIQQAAAGGMLGATQGVGAAQIAQGARGGQAQAGIGGTAVGLGQQYLPQLNNLLNPTDQFSQFDQGLNFDPTLDVGGGGGNVSDALSNLFGSGVV